MLNVTQAVTYNRRAKSYIAQLEDTKIGEEVTRPEAERLLIEAVAPDLARRIAYIGRHCGEAAEKRAHRGAKLVLLGAVEQAEDGQGWTVASETEEGKRYAVIYRQGQWYCGCADWENGWYGQSYGAPHVEAHGIMCKHCFAVKLSNRRGE